MPFQLRTKVGFSTGDLDVSDLYVFTLAPRDDGGLDVGFESTTSKGSFVVDAKAIESAKLALVISQGSVGEGSKDVKEGGRAKKAVPPFLLSRAVFAKARTGKPVKWNMGVEDEAELTLMGTGEVAIEQDGVASSIACIQLEGDALTLWVADDPEWPWVLRVDAGDPLQWTALATADALTLAHTIELSETEPPEPTLVPPPKKKGEPDAAAFLAKGKGSETKLRAAARECAKRTDAESRDALITALVTGPLRGDATSLRARWSEPGFAEAVSARVERALADVSADDGNDAPSMNVLALMVQRTVTAEHLRAHPPLAALLRRAALEHPNGEVRWTMRWFLCSHLADGELGDTLIASTDAEALAADPHLGRAWGTMLPRRRPPAEAVEIIRRLTAELPPENARSAHSAFLYGTDLQDARWAAPLLEWQKTATGETRDQIESRLSAMRSYGVL